MSSSSSHYIFYDHSNLATKKKRVPLLPPPFAVSRSFERVKKRFFFIFFFSRVVSTVDETAARSYGIFDGKVFWRVSIIILSGRRGMGGGNVPGIFTTII